MDNQDKQIEPQDIDGYAVTFQPTRMKNGRWQTQIGRGDWSDCTRPAYFVPEKELDEVAAIVRNH